MVKRRSGISSRELFCSLALALALAVAFCLGPAAERVYAAPEETTVAPAHATAKPEVQERAAGTAAAADDPASRRATAFRSVSGASIEQVSGLQLMVAAYALIWLLVLAYVGRLAALQARSEREQRRLERLLATDKTSGASGDSGSP